jgi:hypothetical protein
VKLVVLFAFCVFATGMLLSASLPALGIPRSHWLPPPAVYALAAGQTAGTLTGKYAEPSSNPFRVGEQIYFVRFRFPARAPMTLGEKAAGRVRVYEGLVRVEAGDYKAAQIGERVPVRYEPTYPYVNGIPSLPGGGRGVGEGSAVLGGWLVWPAATLLGGYLLMSLLQGIAARRSY